MDTQELDTLLERLHAELERADRVDDKGRELLRRLDNDIHNLLGQPEPGSNPLLGLAQSLKESIAYLEATHPRVTAVLSDRVNSLSNAGL